MRVVPHAPSPEIAWPMLTWLALLMSAAACDLGDAATTARDAAPPGATGTEPSDPWHVDLQQAFSLRDADVRLVRAEGRTPLADVTSPHVEAPLLAVNAGFFDGELRPLGLAASAGEELSPLDHELGGGVLWIADGVAHLTAAEDFRETAYDLALQARPRLVVAGRNNITRDDGARAARTAVCIRRGGRELLVVRRAAGDGRSLHALARELVRAGCEEALNLDGGPSAAWTSAGGPHLEPRTRIAMVLVVERAAAP